MADIPSFTSAAWGQPPQYGLQPPSNFMNFDVGAGSAPTSSLSNIGLGNVGVSQPSSIWDGILGKTLGDGTKVQGWGSLGLGVASGVLNGWLGLQQLGLAKDAAAQNRKQFDLNYAAQTKTTNASLEDRQRARVASNSSAYQSVGDYMKKYGIGG